MHKIKYSATETEDEKWGDHFFLWGRNKQGDCEMLYVHGMKNFVYLDIGEPIDESMCAGLITFLRKKKVGGKPIVFSSDRIEIDVVDRFPSNHCGALIGRKNKALFRIKYERRKILFSLQSLCTEETVLIAQLSAEGLSLCLYEDNVSLMDRFCVDFPPCTWTCYTNATELHGCTTNPHDRLLKVHVDNLYVDRDDLTLPKIVICSWDIETKSLSASFSEVFQIGLVFQYSGEKEPFSKVLLCLRKCNDIEGVDVRCFIDEADLLLDFQTSIKDVDILLAYNGDNFDAPFINQRASTLGILPQFQRLGRLLDRYTLREVSMGSKQKGKQETLVWEISGRIVRDGLKLARTKLRELSRHSLNLVGKAVVNDTKTEGISYEGIRDEFSRKEEKPDKIAEIGVYCIQDCVLVLKIYESKKWCSVVNNIFFSKICLVPFSWIDDRGEQIKIKHVFLDYWKKHKIVMASSKFVSDTYCGGHVFDPIVGPHYNVLVVDFKSLYPSVMMSDNMCYSTCLPQDTPRQWIETALEKKEIFEVVVDSDTRYYFDLRFEGWLPDILAFYGNQRNDVKREMRTCEDEVVLSMLNSKQLAIKLIMNSMYGFLGAKSDNGILPDARIAASITSRGRGATVFTADVAERTSVVKDKEGNFQIEYSDKGIGNVAVYGDTDSVMISLDENALTVKELFEVGTLYEKFLTECIRTQRSPRPDHPFQLILEFEKCYEKLVLMAKKRYFGLKRESPNETPKLDMKGVETVRRDTSALNKRVLQELMVIILEERDDAKLKLDVEMFIKESVSSIYSDGVPLKDILTSKGLSKKPSQYKSMPSHAVVASRNPSIRVGDRVPFVYGVGEGKKTI